VRAARLKAGLTQREVAGERFTKAYVSALEHGHLRPSMAGLAYIAERVGTTASELLAVPRGVASADMLDADLRLAAGHWQSAVDAYVALLDRAPTPEQRAAIQLGQAEAFHRLGRAGQAIAAAADAERFYAAAGRPRETALARYWLAAGYHRTDNFARAREVLESLLAATADQPDPDPDLRLRALIALGTVEANAGEHRHALTYLEEARALAGMLDDRRRAAFLYALSYSYREAGDREAAVRTGLQSLGLYRAAEAQAEADSIANELALAYLAAGNLRRARSYAREALGAFEAAADRWWLATAHATASRIELAAGNLARARARVQQARAAAAASGNEKARIESLWTEGRIEHAAGDDGRAIELMEQAIALAGDDLGQARWRPLVAELADLLAAAGRHDRAFELTRAALRT